MSAPATSSRRTDVGRCDGSLTCRYLEPCEAEAVYVVPRPAVPRPADCPVCPYHLALFGTDEPETYRRLQEHSEVADPEPLADDDPWLSLEAAPATVNGARRLCLDGLGSIHYYTLVAGDDKPRVRIIVYDGCLDVDEVFEYPRDMVEACDWLDHVEEARGVLAVDDEHLAPDQTDGGDNDD